MKLARWARANASCLCDCVCVSLCVSVCVCVPLCVSVCVSVCASCLVAFAPGRQFGLGGGQSLLEELLLCSGLLQNRSDVMLNPNH